MQANNVPNHLSATPELNSVNENEIFRNATAAHLYAKYKRRLKGEHLLVVALHYSIPQVVAERLPTEEYTETLVSSNLGMVAKLWSKKHGHDEKKFGAWYIKQRHRSQFASRDPTTFSLDSFETMVAADAHLFRVSQPAPASAAGMKPQISSGAKATSSTMARPAIVPASQQTSSFVMQSRAFTNAVGTGMAIASRPSGPSTTGEPVYKCDDDPGWRNTLQAYSVSSAPSWVKQVAKLLHENKFRLYLSTVQGVDCIFAAKPGWSGLLNEVETNPIPMVPNLIQLEDHSWKWFLHLAIHTPSSHLA